VLDSPFVANAQFEEMVSHFNGDSVVEIDCTFPSGGGQGALRRAGAHSSRGRRCRALGCGSHHPDGPGAGRNTRAMPMILATSAVHSWLTRQGLRTFCSLNVRSAECIDPHYFAVLVGCGATVVNAYLAQDSHRRPDRARADRRHADRGDGTLSRRPSTRAC
jgi:glutamate synthase (NADPH/NADH) large chain